MRDEVLVYHCCRTIRGSGAFARFIGSTDCTFATVKRRKNVTVLYDSAIWCNGQEKDSVVNLAETIIDP